MSKCPSTDNPLIVYIDKRGHYLGLVHPDTHEMPEVRLVITTLKKKDKRSQRMLSQSDRPNSNNNNAAEQHHSRFHPFTSAGHDLRPILNNNILSTSSSLSSSSSSSALMGVDSTRHMAAEAALFHHARLGPSSATQLGTKFKDCLFDYRTLSPSSGAHQEESESDGDDSNSDVDDEGSADPDDNVLSTDDAENMDIESDNEDASSSQEQRNMAEASRARDGMLNAESESSLPDLHSERGGGRGFGGGFGGGRSFGGGGGGGGGGGRGSFRFTSPARPAISPVRPSILPVRSTPALMSPTTRVLNPPGYARVWTRAPRGYNPQVWSRRYRPFAPFLPLFYASLAVPWGLWYPSTRYVFLTNPYRLQYGLPLLPRIPLNAPLGWIEGQLIALRARYLSFRTQGYEIVPRFYGLGTGRFVWVMTNNHPGHLAVYNDLGGNVYGGGVQSMY